MAQRVFDFDKKNVNESNLGLAKKTSEKANQKDAVENIGYANSIEEAAEIFKAMIVATGIIGKNNIEMKDSTYSDNKETVIGIDVADMRDDMTKEKVGVKVVIRNWYPHEHITGFTIHLSAGTRSRLYDPIKLKIFNSKVLRDNIINMKAVEERRMSPIIQDKSDPNKMSFSILREITSIIAEVLTEKVKSMNESNLGLAKKVSSSKEDVDIEGVDSLGNLDVITFTEIAKKIGIETKLHPREVSDGQARNVPMRKWWDTREVKNCKTIRFEDLENSTNKNSASFLGFIINVDPKEENFTISYVSNISSEYLLNSNDIRWLDLTIENLRIAFEWLEYAFDTEGMDGSWPDRFEGFLKSYRNTSIGHVDNYIFESNLGLAKKTREQSRNDDPVDRVGVIRFEDPLVEEICHANGIYTYEDASNETGLYSVDGKGMFDLWFHAKKIKKFNELKWFTGLKKIDYSTFAYCNELEEITLPEGIESIKDHAFRSCSNLMKIDIPEGVKEIGSNAFDSCRSLRRVSLPLSLESVGFHAFEGVYSLSDFTVPAGYEKNDFLVSFLENQRRIHDRGIIVNDLKESQLGLAKRVSDTKNVDEADVESIALLDVDEFIREMKKEISLSWHADIDIRKRASTNWWNRDVDVFAGISSGTSFTNTIFRIAIDKGDNSEYMTEFKDQHGTTIILKDKKGEVIWQPLTRGSIKRTLEWIEHPYADLSSEKVKTIEDLSESMSLGLAKKTAQKSQKKDAIDNISCVGSIEDAGQTFKRFIEDSGVLEEFNLEVDLYTHIEHLNSVSICTVAINEKGEKIWDKFSLQVFFREWPMETGFTMHCSKNEVSERIFKDDILCNSLKNEDAVHKLGYLPIIVNKDDPTVMRTDMIKKMSDYVIDYVRDTFESLKESQLGLAKKVSNTSKDKNLFDQFSYVKSIGEATKCFVDMLLEIGVVDNKRVHAVVKNIEINSADECKKIMIFYNPSFDGSVDDSSVDNSSIQYDGLAVIIRDWKRRRETSGIAYCEGFTIHFGGKFKNEVNDDIVHDSLVSDFIVVRKNHPTSGTLPRVGDPEMPGYMRVDVIKRLAEIVSRVVDFKYNTGFLNLDESELGLAKKISKDSSSRDAIDNYAISFRDPIVMKICHDNGIYTAEDAANIKYNDIVNDMYNHKFTFRDTEIESFDELQLFTSLEIIPYAWFAGCSKLKSVKLPPGLKILGDFAFNKTASLEKIVIPKSVDRIARSAFSCSGIKEVLFEEPNDKIDLEGSAFINCMNLTEVTLPSGLTWMQEEVFWQCKSLKDVWIPADSKVDYIHVNMFRKTLGRDETPDIETTLHIARKDLYIGLMDNRWEAPHMKREKIKAVYYGQEALEESSLGLAKRVVKDSEGKTVEDVASEMDTVTYEEACKRVRSFTKICREEYDSPDGGDRVRYYNEDVINEGALKVFVEVGVIKDKEYDCEFLTFCLFTYLGFSYIKDYIDWILPGAKVVSTDRFNVISQNTGSLPYVLSNVNLIKAKEAIDDLKIRGKLLADAIKKKEKPQAYSPDGSFEKGITKDDIIDCIGEVFQDYNTDELYDYAIKMGGIGPSIDESKEEMLTPAMILRENHGDICQAIKDATGYDAVIQFDKTQEYISKIKLIIESAGVRYKRDIDLDDVLIEKAKTPEALWMSPNDTEVNEAIAKAASKFVGHRKRKNS